MRWMVLALALMTACGSTDPSDWVLDGSWDLAFVSSPEGWYGGDLGYANFSLIGYKAMLVLGADTSRFAGGYRFVGTDTLLMSNFLGPDEWTTFHIRRGILGENYVDFEGLELIADDIGWKLDFRRP